MTPALYDAHQHFHFDSLVPYHEAMAKEFARIGLHRAVVNGTNEEEWPIVATLAQRFSWVHPSYGVHPWDCGNRSAHYLTALRARLLAEPSAAVGEIGLDRWIIDGIRPDDPRIAGLRVASIEEQSETFVAQLSLAAEFNRAASIHCVQAWGALLDLLQNSSRPARGFLLHGYNGPTEMVRPFAKLGAYFSFNIELLHARQSVRLENFKTIPFDRLLVETDAPTKAPPAELNRYPLLVGADGVMINHPANIAVAYQALADLRTLSLETLATQVASNFHRLFG